MVKSVFDLDMTPGRMLPLIINVSQYDDIGRTIVFNLYSSVGAWTAPTSASVTFEGGKPDGKFFAYNCAYSSGTATVTIQQQMTAVAGKVRCKIKVTSGSKVVESASIIMVVDAAAVPDGSDMSKTDINDAVANATQKIVDQVKDNIPSDYAQLSTDVSSLKSDIGNIKGNVGGEKSTDFSLVSGGFQIGTGINYSDTNVLRFEQLVHFTVGDKLVVDSSIQWCWAKYADEKGTDFIDTRSDGFTTGTYVSDTDAWYKFMFRDKKHPSSDISNQTELYKEYIHIAYAEPKTGIIKDVSDLKVNFDTLKNNVSKIEENTASKCDLSAVLKKNVSDLVISIEKEYSELELKGINADGTLIDVNTQRHLTIDNVKENEIISVNSYYITSGGKKGNDFPLKILAVCSYNEKNEIIESKGKRYNASLSEFTVPPGITKIIITINPSANFNYIIASRTEINGKIDRIIRQRVNGKPFTYSGELKAQNVVSLGFENVWTNKVWIFSGKIEQLESSEILKIGACNNGNILRPYIEVTENKANVYSALGESFDKSYDHNLNITNDIDIIGTGPNTF